MYICAHKLHKNTDFPLKFCPFARRLCDAVHHINCIKTKKKKITANISYKKKTANVIYIAQLF